METVLIIPCTCIMCTFKSKGATSYTWIKHLNLQMLSSSHSKTVQLHLGSLACIHSFWLLIIIISETIESSTVEDLHSYQTSDCKFITRRFHHCIPLNSSQTQQWPCLVSSLVLDYKPPTIKHYCLSCALQD